MKKKSLKKNQTDVQPRCDPQNTTSPTSHYYYKKKKTWMIKYLRKFFQCFMCFKKLKYICLKIDLFFLKEQELLNR